MAAAKELIQASLIDRTDGCYLLLCPSDVHVTDSGALIARGPDAMTSYVLAPSVWEMVTTIAVKDAEEAEEILLGPRNMRKPT